MSHSDEATAMRLDIEAGLQNLRAMFRQTMFAAALPGESLAAARARIAADPATREVAKRLRCSVDELLLGFGEAQDFIVDEDYDHRAATREIGRVIESVADSRPALGSADTLELGERSTRRPAAPRALPEDRTRSTRVHGTLGFAEPGPDDRTRSTRVHGTLGFAEPGPDDRPEVRRVLGEGEDARLIREHLMQCTAELRRSLPR